MQDIASNLNRIKEELPKDCTLVAVSKTKPNEAILEAYKTGQRDFGENKVQELAKKAEELPHDIRWHMIGHLQRNKVKYIASFVHLIHGVDSLKLLKEIDKQAEKATRTINCLLQVHIAEEESKFGFSANELEAMVMNDELAELPSIRVVGLMGMATFTPDETQIHKEFQSLKLLFEKLKDRSIENFHMEVLSIGMSGDYKIALQEGSNMVRVGSAIFGERNY